MHENTLACACTPQKKIHSNNVSKIQYFQVVTVAKEDLRAEVGVCERSGSIIFVGDDHITLSCSERCGGVFLKVFFFQIMYAYTLYALTRTHTHTHPSKHNVW